MAKDYPALNAHQRDFIARQHIFFTASAAAGSRINLSPRSTDLFRVLSDNAACYLDRTGSGNETAAHLRADGRLTIMFCAVEGPPLILRLYGRGQTIARGGAQYATLLAEHYGNTEPLGARQIVRIDFSGSEPVLIVGGARVNLSSVLSVRSKTATDATSEEGTL